MSVKTTITKSDKVRYTLEVSYETRFITAVCIISHADYLAKNCSPDYATKELKDFRKALVEIGWNTSRIDEMLAELKAKLKAKA